MAKGNDTRPSRRPARSRRRRGRRERSLAGTNLFREVRTDILIWRKTHPVTKERLKISTGTDVLEYALAKAQEFEDKLAREVAGIKSYDGWTRTLAPLIDEWLDDQRQQERPPQERWLRQKGSQLRVVLKALKLRRAADLTDVSKIDRRLKALDLPDVTRRRRYQDPLKQFSAWLAANGRYLEYDPLACWVRIQYEAKEKHRAFEPEEVARAFVAAAWLDRIHNRAHSLVPVFKVLLIAAPRAEALVSRDDGEARIDFGEGRYRKGRGQGKLDAETARELRGYIGERQAGPLLLSPRGRRLSKRNLLRWWKEAFGLGLVWELWPEEEPWSVDLGHFVNRVLLRRKLPARGPGNPKVTSKKTKQKRRARAQRVADLADELRAQWEERMLGVTLHAFRHTHETWALSAGVEQILIDLHVGWRASPERGRRGIVGSVASTGAKHYLDRNSRLLESRESARAVRSLLEECPVAAQVNSDEAA